MCVEHSASYKEFGYFAEDAQGNLELDYGMAGIVTQESFDLTTKKGRDEHFQLGLNRYECGQKCNAINYFNCLLTTIGYILSYLHIRSHCQTRHTDP
jgi:hypothetical protein